MFPTAFIIVVGFIGSALTIFEFVNSRIGNSPQRSQRLAIVIAAITIVSILISVIFANFLAPQGGSGPGTTPTTSGITQPSGTGNTPLSTQVPPTQPPPQPSSYTANWSQGNDGWNGTSDWSVYGGELHNSGLNNHSDDTPTITAPFQPNSDDYAMEMTFRTPTQYNGHCFGVTVRGSNSADGTMSGYSINFWCNSRGITSIRAFSGSSEGSTYDTQFDPGTAWHTLRVEVKLNTIKLFIDGGLLLNVTDNAYPTGRIIGLWSDQQPLDISSCKISPL